jgi:hypothetical protein
VSHSANYRWVIVAAGGFLGCVAMGSLFSLPVFIIPISEAGNFGWMYIACFGMGLGAFLIAMMFRPFPQFNQPEPAPKGA